MKYKKEIFSSLFFICLIFYSPRFARADVLINEIAWLGTAESQYNEWVELYNNGNEEVDLSGWSLWEQDESGIQTKIISLTKKILPQNYYLVVRITGSAGNPFSNFDDEGFFKGNGFLNTGENVILKDSSSNEVDAVMALGQWESSTRDGRTMQKKDGSWIMAQGTPKSQNAIESILENNENSDPDTSSSTPGGFVNLSSHSSQSDLSDYEEDEIKIGAGRPRLASVKTPIEFKVESEGTLSGLLMWSFGDGTSAIGANVWHKYEFPGQYNVVLNFSGEKEAVSRTTATVTEANFSLDVSLAGGYVEIKNLGSQEENINDWTIKNGTTTVFTFAKDTIISSHSDLKVALPKEMLNFNLSLNYPDGEVQARIGNLTSVAQIAELRAKLSEAEKILAEIKGQERIAVWTALPAAQTARAGSNLKVLQPLISSTSQPTLASSSDIIVIKKKEGMIGRILKVFNFF